MRMPLRVAWLALLGMLAAGLAPTVSAAEPEARFQRSNGFAQLKLTQNGKPVVGATVRARDITTFPFAEGATDRDGAADFPIPRGPGFIVEFTIGDRTSDPIWLQTTGNSLEPEAVLLSFGLHPCCRMADVAASPASPARAVASPGFAAFGFWGRLSVALVLLGSGGLALGWAFRRPVARPTVATGEET
jgi:hypothetical protein